MEDVVEKAKIGEEEYTQDELSHLVGLGKLGREAEEKFNVSLDKVWPNHQRTINEKRELEEELQRIKAEREESNKPQDGLTEEQRNEVRKQLKEIYGDEPLTKKDFEQYYVTRRQAEKLIDEVESLVTKHKEEGNPATTVDDLLKYMEENGVRNPNAAYKLMFENELDAIKEKKLSSIKQNGIVTQNTSSAGGKQPEPVKITRDNLNSLITGRLSIQE